MGLTKSQSRLLSQINEAPRFNKGTGELVFAGRSKGEYDLVAINTARPYSPGKDKAFVVYLGLFGKLGGVGGAVELEPDQARELARLLEENASRVLQLRREKQATKPPYQEVPK